MGGNIGVTIREENGTEHRMSRWTNPIPWFINNLKFLNKNPSHLQEYLKTWYDMRTDWLEHKNDDKFELNMTPVYARHPYLAPDEYGLIVIDMQRNVILEYQGYTIIGGIHSATICYERDLGESMYTDGEMDTNRLRELFDAGKVKSIETFAKVASKSKYKKMTIDLSGQKFDEVIKTTPDFARFLIDMSPYEVIHYEDRNSNEAKRMLRDIKKLGFKITPEEKKIWSQWIRDHS